MFADFVLGKEFLIETDQKLLVPLLGSKCLQDMPPRIQRFRIWPDHNALLVPNCPCTRKRSHHTKIVVIVECLPTTECRLQKYTFIRMKMKFRGHPTTVLGEISVRRSKNCLEFSEAWGRLKISRWPFHSCTIFEAYLMDFLRLSEFNVSHFTPQINLFFVERGNLKFPESKMRFREESEKFSFS